MKSKPKPGYKMTEIGQIPEEWEVVRLGDEKYFTILKSGIEYFERFKEYLSTSSIQRDKIVAVELKITYNSRPSRANMQPRVNSVWFAKMKNTIKVYCFTNNNINETKRFILSTGFCGILCKKLIYPAYQKQVFLWSYFNKIKDELTTGSTQQAVNNDSIQLIPIPLPSLIEQQKIAEILSTTDKAIQKTDEIIERTQELKKGLMQRLLTKGIGHTKFKQTEIGEIPEEWEVVRLGDILSVCQYGLSIKLFSKGKYPILRMDNLEGGYIVTDDLTYVNIDEDLFNQFKLEKGDILFNRTNAYDLVGKVGIFLLDGDYTFASYLIRIRTFPEKANPLFVNYYLNADATQYRLKSLATRGVSQANINAKNLKSLLIHIPHLPEQQKIAEILSTVNEKIEKEKLRKEQLEKLKKGLMQDLLTGRVRVKVD